MLVTQDITILAAHEKKPLQHLVNIGRKKRTGALFTSENGTNNELQLTTQNIAECNMIPQQIRPTALN